MVSDLHYFTSGVRVGYQGRSGAKRTLAGTMSVPPLADAASKTAKGVGCTSTSLVFLPPQNIGMVVYVRVGECVGVLVGAKIHAVLSWTL